MRGYPTRKEGRAPCLDPAIDYEHRRLNTNCVGLGAVRAVFAPPSPDTPVETGGALTLWSMAFEKGLCTVSDESVFVADVDDDDKLEMVIDVKTARSYEVGRGSYEQAFTRFFYLFPGSEDVEGVVRLALGNWHTDPGSSDNVPDEDLVEFRDVNRDGRRDLIQTDLFDVETCDEDGKPLSDLDTDKPNPCLWENRGKTVYLYDAKLDRWVAPEIEVPADAQP
jgi:hypothetical protein